MVMTSPTKAAILSTSHRVHAVMDALAREHRINITPYYLGFLAQAVAEDLTPPGAEPLPPPAQARPKVRELTDNRVEILRLTANGMTNAEIGFETFRTEDTIKTTMRIILKYLGARDRTHAVAIAMSLGIITPDDIKMPKEAP